MLKDGTAMLLLWLIFPGTQALGDFTTNRCKILPSDPSLPKASCELPPCPKGSDCTSPKVVAGKIAFDQPARATWLRDCHPTHPAGCWETEFVFHLRVKATDNYLIRQVGVRLKLQTGSERMFRDLWKPVVTADGNGFYGFEYHLEERVPAGKKVDLSAVRFCAGDMAGNEVCLPAEELAEESPSFTWQAGNRPVETSERKRDGEISLRALRQQPEPPERS